MSITPYEVYAIRYACRNVNRPANFVGGDPHDAPMNMDYFVWLAKNADKAAALGRAMAELLGSAERRAQLGRAARRRAGDYSSERMIEGNLAVYNRLIASAATGAGHAAGLWRDEHSSTGG